MALKAGGGLFSALLLLLVWPLSAGAAVDACLEGQVPLYGQAFLLEDPTHALEPAEVLALPLSAFVPYRLGPPNWNFTRSAIWLRFTLQNERSGPCSSWLTIGEPRLEELKVYSKGAGGWSLEQAGSLVPLEQWDFLARQPRFELQLQPGEQRQVLVRIVSRSSMWLAPTLWDQQTLIESMSAEHLLDGFTVGAVLLIVLVGLVVGVVIRSKVLVLNGLALLFYCTFVLAVDGYLFYWPTLLPWSRAAVAILSAITYAFGYFFIFELFRMRFLGRWFNAITLGLVCVTVFVLLQGAFGDFFMSRERFYILLFGIYILLPVSLLLSVIRRVPVSWLAWLLCLQLSFQGIYWLYRNVVLDYEFEVLDGFSLQTSFFLALVLVCTLISEVRQLRKREREANEEVAHLQRAKHERLESQVEQRTTQLRESLEARSSLLGRISHDLRSPLGSIINYAREARASSSVGYLRRIERLAGQQLSLLDDLVALSRVELQHIELSLAPGYLFGFLREIEEEGSFLAQRGNNVLRCDFAEDLPAIVNADFQQLRRVLMNLLSNAAKFTRDGLIVLQVSAVREEASVRLRFTVRDTGVGFPAENSYRMLEAFRRGDNASGVDGFGLGLSIVVELLKQMDAALQVNSVPGGGSAFSFALQLEVGSEEEVDSVFHEDYASGVDGDGFSILLVDDVELTREFLGDLLLGYGFDVVTVATAEEALEELERSPFDLLVTDQLMPGIDGWELLQVVRSRYGALPVLLYSSLPPRPKAAYSDLAFDASLLKPSSTEALLEQVQSLCERRRQAD